MELQSMDAFLLSEGFVRVPSNIRELTLYLKNEYNFVNMILLLDFTNGSTCDSKQYEAIRRDSRAVLEEKGLHDIHILTLIMMQDVDIAREISADDRFCWVLKPSENKLIIEENKAEDFYGMKRRIEYYLSHTDEYVQMCEKFREEAENVEKPQPMEKKKIFIPKVTMILIVMNLIAFLLCAFASNLLYNGNGWSYEDILQAGGFGIEGFFVKHQFYRLFTYMFLHSGYIHLFGNMFMLFIAGRIVEQKLGSWHFIAIYFVSGIAAAVAATFYEWYVQTPSICIGASGAIFGIVGALIWNSITEIAKHRIRITLSILIVIYALGSLQEGFGDSKVSSVAHIGGLLVGFTYSVIQYFRKVKRGGAYED